MYEVQKVETAPGIEIAYQSHGSGPPVIFIHGITENLTVWDQFVGRVSESCRMVAVDLRGHGRSTPVETATITDLVTDILTLAHKLDLGAPALVGHSLGGAVATLCAGSAPVGPVLSIDQPMLMDSFQKVVRGLEPQLKGAHDQFVSALWSEAEDLGVDRLPPDLQAKIRAFREGARQSLVLSLWADLFTQPATTLNARMSTVVEKITAPFFSLHGQDPGLSYAEWLVETLKGPTELELWYFEGHWLHWAAPKRFEARLTDWLARQHGANA